VTDGSAEYPDRAALLGDMRGLLKTAKTPLNGVWERYGLDLNGLRHMDRLARKLSESLHFEHQTREDIEKQLRAAVVRYRALLKETPRPKAEAFAVEVLDGLALPPKTLQVYLGIEHLKLPIGTSLGGVRFVYPDEEVGLVETFGYLGERAPKLLCSVVAVAGTDALALARARRAAISVLGLIRQKVLLGLSAKMYPHQVAFGLDGSYAWKIDGEFSQTGWRIPEHPTEVDLSTQQEWAVSLTELSQRRDALPAELQGHVDTSLDWLDVAAHTTDWRTMLPATFSAMEALLVPETSGLKAGAVTVRSVAVHTALGKGFFDPRKTVEGYDWRSKLVHGAPTHNVNETDLTDLAEHCRLWAFTVFSDYLQLAADQGVTTVKELVAFLDSNKGEDVCRWLLEHGAKAPVDEYRRMLALRSAP
jgi:hypothetical protein